MQRGGNEISFGKKAEKPSVTPLSGRSLPDAAHAIGIITISYNTRVLLLTKKSADTAYATSMTISYLGDLC